MIVAIGLFPAKHLATGSTFSVDGAIPILQFVIAPLTTQKDIFISIPQATLREGIPKQLSDLPYQMTVCFAIRATGDACSIDSGGHNEDLGFALL